MRPRRGFSLIELVVVVIILGVLAVVVIPRVTRGADRADKTATRANAALLNKALGLYASEHDGAFPTAALVADQLTMYSDEAGDNVRRTPDPANGIVHGPYLVKIPPVTHGPNAGNTGIASRRGEGVGWLYAVAKKKIIPNLFDGGGNVPPGTEEDWGVEAEDIDGMR